MSSRQGFFSLRAVWLIPAAAAVSLVLGTWGWLDHGEAPAEALYRAVVLFDLGNDLYLHGVGHDDWRFLIGRWTGISTVFGAGLTALAALLQEHLALGVARWTKQQVMVIGGDALATRAFEIARGGRKSVLWLGASTLGVGSVRAIALPWPPEDPARTVFEHATNADHILVAQEDDARALALVRSARAASPDAFITVIMRDVRLAEDAAATFNQARTRVLSQGAIAARALDVEHPPFLLARDLGHARIHALIVGFGQTGQAIARDLIVNCRTTYLGLPRITVIDPKARQLEGVLRVRAPEIDACADFRFVEGEIGSRAIAPDPASLSKIVADGGPVTAAYVCLSADTEALASAGMLQSLLRTIHIGTPAIFVRLRDVDVVSKAADEQHGLDALMPFGDLDSILTASEFLSNTPDASARAFNEAYRANLTPERRDDPANRSARAWDVLDETFRQASRDAVAHIPAKLASAGIDPALWRGGGMPRLSRDQHLYADDVELEALARLEHERWNAQRRMDGWRWTDRPSRDDIKRLHPSLVGFDELTDPVKEYDRVYVRETQLTCWGADEA